MDGSLFKLPKRKKYCYIEKQQSFLKKVELPFTSSFVDNFGTHMIQQHLLFLLSGICFKSGVAITTEL